MATFEDLAARDDPDRLEIVDGVIVEKAAPSMEHSWAETKLVAATDPFNRKPGSRGPGGWWIVTEIHVEYPRGEVYCHDVAGWRRDRVPVRPTGWPIRVRPDPREIRGRRQRVFSAIPPPAPPGDPCGAP